MEGNASVYQVNPVSRITGEGKAEFLTASGGGEGAKKSCRIDVGVCYTRGARSRRWCGWYTWYAVVACPVTTDLIMRVNVTTPIR